MNEIGFYHLTRPPLERALAQLLEKVLAQGERALVLCGETARLAALDDALWTMAEPEWLPHGIAGSEYDALQPILLAGQDITPVNGARCLFLVEGAATARLAAFERVFDLFDGTDQAALAAARARWRAAKAAGHRLSYWRQGPQGWERGT